MYSCSATLTKFYWKISLGKCFFPPKFWSRNFIGEMNILILAVILKRYIFWIFCCWIMVVLDVYGVSFVRKFQREST